MSRLLRRRVPIFYFVVATLFLCVFGSTAFKPHTALGAADNGRIAYAGLGEDSAIDIYTINADGTGKQQLTHDTDGSSYMPVWSPNGTKIAYLGQAGDDPTGQIFVMNADGSNKIDLTNDPSSENLAPAWSPDGSKIAYTSTPSDYSTPSTIRIMHTDGTDAVTITDGSADDTSASWSPDGNTLVFICTDGQHVDQLCTMNADGSNRQQITSGTTTDYNSVAYSPTRTELAYTTISHGGGYIQHLGTMNADGSNSQTITTSHTSSADVSWSPDGTKLLYDDYDTGNSVQRIYYISTDGSGETAVSPSDQYAASSSWQPLSIDDSDNDGVTNAVEDAAPNSGDANGDGTADKHQASVASVLDPVTNNYVSLQSSCAANLAVSAEALPASYADTAFHYPAGLLGFTLTCGTNGATATVTQYFYGVSAQSTMVLRKYNSSTHAYATIPGTAVTAVTIGGQTVTKVSYQTTDGGPFDQDGLSNGVIVDPVGLAIPAAGTPNTGVGGAILFPRDLAAPLL